MDHHYVYVILLEPLTAKVKAAIRNTGTGLPAVYVGMTGLTVAERVQTHKESGRGVVAKCFDRVEQSFGPMSEPAARKMEEVMARNCKIIGYAVFGGH